jgi:predicted DCC family thiol-disulfide oxidoreductase YuxK
MSLVRYVHIAEAGKTNMLVVFYNTRCPVCDAGIKMQRNALLLAVKAGLIEFRDINLEPDALAPFQATIEDIRKRLHALEDGRLIIGADVALAVWRLTPGQNWLATIFGNPVTKPLTRIGYNILAELLYAWNRYKRHW